MLKRFLFLCLLPFVTLAADEEQDLIEEALRGLIEQFIGPGETLDDQFSRTSHEIVLNGNAISYTAIAGSLPQYGKEAEPAGHLFFTAYLKDGAEEGRPVTFIFNGGPGGSSLSMHIAGLGPRRLLFPEEGQKTTPPFSIIDNPQSILDLTDIVMIDPIGTGYSRSGNPAYDDFFYSVEGDIASFAEFIRGFSIHFERWNSPKYALGASYGTCRACGLAERLMDTAGIYLDGVILLGCALDFNFHWTQRDLALAEELLIPTLAATAWYHGRSNQDKTLKETLEYARRFALEDYHAVMAQPTRLGRSELHAFYQELSDLIGLPVPVIERHQGRIDEHTYVTEFMAPDRKYIGGIDSRYVGDITSIYGEYHEDPSYRNFRPAFFPAFMHYLQNELGLKTIYPKYYSFSEEAFWRWNWGTYDSSVSSPPNFMQRLRRSLVAHPAMKIFVGSGYYDIRTPFAAAEYSIDHLGLPETYRKNFHFGYYEAGHGFIFDLASLKQFKRDLVHFYRWK